MTRVVCIGECMIEMRAMGENSFSRSYAGDVYNTAVYLKRSLPDAQVQFASATGDDAASAAMRRSWQAERIDDSLSFIVKGVSPGLYFIETDARGERRFQYWRGNSAARQWLKQLMSHESALWGADVIYLSGITLAILPAEERDQAIEFLKRLRGRVAHIAFDPNVRLNLWESSESAAANIAAAFAVCDIALPSTEDLTCLFHIDQPLQQLALLREWGVLEAAITLGAGGCLVGIQSPRQLSAPSVASVVDTSGAGDAFNGAYLASRLSGCNSAQAAQAGLQVASRVVTCAGAVVPGAVSHPCHDKATHRTE
jgi:2-dehydro-3-deoxygluconokinase